MLKRFFGLSLVIALAAGVLAQKNRVAPEVAHPNALKLVTEIQWNDSLEASLAQARKEDKLVFYMHMLGKIDGDT